MFDINQIKDRISCFIFARDHLGLPLSRPGTRCKSYRQGAKNKTSLLVNERDWYDFGDSVGGDVIDLCSRAMFSGDTGQAIRHLANIAGVDGRNTVDWDRLNNQAAFYHSQLREKDWEYLRKRKIQNETIKKLLIGYAKNDGQWKNRIMIPYWKSGRVVYFVGRGENPKYMKMKTEHGQHVIWGVDTIRRDGPVIIAEGAFDALACYQEGYAVLSPITGHFSKHQFYDLLSLTRNRKIIICFDHDPESKAGQKFTVKLADSLVERGYRVYTVTINGEDKKVDLSDLYAQGMNLKDLFDAAEDYRIQKIKSIQDKQEMTKFLTRIRLCMPWPELAELIDEIDQFSDTWIKETKRILQRPPSDDSVIQQIERDHNIIYHDQLGWYDYKNGYWIKREESEIKHWIGEIFGHMRTGARISSVYSVGKAHFSRLVKFNSNPDILNMKNGMLNVKSGELTAHDPGYFSNIQLNYSYNPDAKCENWKEFVHQIAGYDDRRYYQIQEMFGYVLSGSCKHEVCFFLIGDGANGKSKLLDILTLMVGVENVSNIEMSALTEPFQRISLHSSIVNIATETKTDVKGAETIFKQIVAGEPITGCYKGKDFYSFRPRCKMINAANEFIHSRDLSFGFLRRIRFMNFPMKFVDEPKRSNEIKRDRQIIEKLKPELPGILNWAIDGLRQLEVQGEFTDTKDQSEMMNTFIEISSPVHSFLKEIGECVAENTSGWYRRSEIYNAYHFWSERTGGRPVSARKFWPKIRQILNGEIPEKTINGDRMVYLDTFSALIEQVQVRSVLPENCINFKEL